MSKLFPPSTLLRLRSSISASCLCNCACTPPIWSRSCCIFRSSLFCSCRARISSFLSHTASRRSWTSFLWNPVKGASIHVNLSQPLPLPSYQKAKHILQLRNRSRKWWYTSKWPAKNYRTDAAVGESSSCIFISPRNPSRHLLPAVTQLLWRVVVRGLAVLDGGARMAALSWPWFHLRGAAQAWSHGQLSGDERGGENRGAIRQEP